jgi:ABC-type uncharacterized transport system substrate-binding protein
MKQLYAKRAQSHENSPRGVENLGVWAPARSAASSSNRSLRPWAQVPGADLNCSESESTLKDVATAAPTIGLETRVLDVGTGTENNAAFAAFASQPPDALLVAGDAFFSSRRVQLVHLATRHGIPAMYSQREFTDVGGLISYGPNLADVFRQVGAYVGRILKGSKPTDLPVMQSSKFELVINAEAARNLHLAVPPTLLPTADEVIE